MNTLLSQKTIEVESKLLLLCSKIAVAYRQEKKETHTELTAANYQLLTMEQACEALKIGRSTIYRLVNSSSLIAVKLLGRTLFRPDDVAKYIASLDAFESPPNAF